MVHNGRFKLMFENIDGSMTEAWFDLDRELDIPMVIDCEPTVFNEEEAGEAAQKIIRDQRNRSDYFHHVGSELIAHIVDQLQKKEGYDGELKNKLHNQVAAWKMIGYRQ